MSEEKLKQQIRELEALNEQQNECFENLVENLYEIWSIWAVRSERLKQDLIANPSIVTAAEVDILEKFLEDFEEKFSMKLEKEKREYTIQ